MFGIDKKLPLTRKLILLGGLLLVAAALAWMIMRPGAPLQAETAKVALVIRTVP